MFWCSKFWTSIGWSTLLNKICPKRRFFGLNSFQINFKITLWLLWPLFMDGGQLSQGCKAILRKQFTFYYSVRRISWYSFNQPQKHERLSQPWSHLVAFNLGHQDWESNPLFPVRPLSERSSPSRMSKTLQAGFEPVQNLSSGFVEWSCAVVITLVIY